MSEQLKGRKTLDRLQPGTIPDCADLEISRAGYELWRAAGRPVGRYVEFLIEAERLLKEAATRAKQKARVREKRGESVKTKRAEL